VLGPLVAGFIFDYIGVPAPFLFAALLLLGAFVAARNLRRKPNLTAQTAPQVARPSH
jgi:MFS family permease